MTIIPVKAAEELFFIYSPVNFSVEISSLELFAKEGKVNKNLEFYLQFVTPEQKAAFREVLTKKIDLPPVVISRFFNTSIGEDILTRLGKGITIQGGSNGKYALRAALVQAAFDPEGFTLINVLKKLPTNMEFQGPLLLGFAQESQKFILATETLIKELRQLTLEEATTDRPVDYSQLTDMRQVGPHKFTKEVWNLTDTSRNRSFYVDVYVPQSVDAEMPVVVFSHGLASRPEDYGQALERLASYGFLVAAPQHPGSDSIWAKEVLEGYHQDAFDLNDFINRPKDISFVIDELERRNATQFQNRLNLQNVGMGGHSFGGYTALAIAGAEIDFENLKQECERAYSGVNVALLLQCRAVDLPQQTYNFRDNRVKAVFAANPVNRAIFGPKGLGKITIPIMFGSGSYDPAAPPALEQAASFTWLGSSQKYWAMVEGQAHVNFSELDAGLSKSIETVTQLTLPSQDLITDYTAAIEIPFFEIYINQNEKFRPYLQSAYAEYLSQGKEFKLDLISQASVPKLIDAIEKFKREHP
ncbi:alpha/beta hydrolase [Synechocystis sp. CS-94]|uniref:alpha/beta hydrolase n=1 Tax=Synechocystis sp. CS-94 TaxID=2847986 RepID=UPI0004D1AD61|nr:alpha/beta hydrolase [Synechocystis sp. CS-94]AIE74918.1 putative lipoprotein signal peptide [Synechocystis sp. PCC 6714]MCT0253368.1 alpha/beta hydrolase [Synechocystis sp. CS-94]